MTSTSHGKEGAQVGNSKRSGSGLALALLFLCFAANQLDRTIISFVAVPLKADLDLSDSEFAVITGPVFSITYGLFTLLFAYFSDRGDRAKLLIFVLVFWSLASAACGIASSFLQLLLMRLLVGIGEAGGSPTCMALVTDLSRKERRSSAYAIYVLGAPFGVLLAALAGSFFAAHFGWRPTFFACGALGLLLAGVMKLKLHDPRPVGSVMRTAKATSVPLDLLRGIAHAFKAMRLYPSTMLIMTSFAFSFFLGGGMVNWAPIFFNRLHGLSADTAAIYVGIAYCTGIIPGIILGGIVSDRLSKKNLMWPIHLSEISLLLSLPMYICAYYISTWPVAIVTFGLGIFFSQMSMGPILAAFNAPLPSDIRSTANAGILLGAAVVSGGGGNLLVGVLSDQLSGSFGIFSLRISLIAVTFSLTTISVVSLMRARHYYAADLELYRKY